MTSSLRNNDTADSDEDAEAMVMPVARRFSLSASALKAHNQVRTISRYVVQSSQSQRERL